MKADIYEGGHRIPLAMQWPAVIPRKSISTVTVSLADLYATFADLTHHTMREDEGEDSFSLLPILLKHPHNYHRNHTIVHSFYGKYGIREGKWFLALCPGSGGWSHPKDEEAYGSPPMQLFDMEQDPSQTTNLLVKKSTEHVAIQTRLTETLKRIKDSNGQRKAYSLATN
jgi:arylsulfatase A